ncbi:Uncharacterized protein PECH_007327 [Penicillium ucsense]|uniref:Integral membrane bound transporter domain-containing protein n=1 Tax=Penicillium ucsense TaxID=2839758 RepID=A0A8J8W1X3_9EURO|nr:Uncharacterized protein PECM_007836 [Penicillium ucsense]KAF7734959.1 Uncharacterized protein PECH_007327 [Penicillium ucsense]
MAVFIPFVGALLGKQYGKHLVATITVYFHPARSQGAMYKALICASVAFLFASCLSLGSMWVTITFHRKHGLIELGHAIVLIIFVTGGFGLIGWVKQRQQDPLVNIACSLASLASVLVLIKEGAVQSGDLSFTKISQILRMLLLGIGVSTAVSFAVFPVSARKKFRRELSVLASTATTMLMSISEGFTYGTDRDIQLQDFTRTAALHDETFGRLTALLGETKLEHYVAGTQRQHTIEKDLMHLVRDITHGLGGLRSAVVLQSKLLGRAKHRNNTGTSLPISRTITSNNLDITTQRDENEVNPTASSRINSHELRDMISEEDDLPLSTHSSAEIFEQLTGGLREPIMSHAQTLHEIFAEVNLNSTTEHSHMMNDELAMRITEAVHGYRNARSTVFSSLRQDWGRISPAQVDKARLEELFANSEYFSVSLLELSEQLKGLVLKITEFQTDTDPRPLNALRDWLLSGCWPRRWRRMSFPHGGDASPSRNVQNTPRSIPLVPHSQGMPHLPTRQYRSQDDVVRPLAFLRKDEAKFALKVGIGAALFALPSFISATRPVYLAWRGEWGLISYMLVCSMTIGASNTTGLARFLGTCIGGLCSIGAWYLAGEDAVKLALIGSVMAIGPFYLILVKGQGPMGRFILLTYNLSVLYAFSYSQADPDQSDDGTEHLDITSIVLRRVVSVMLGNIWGIIVTRGIWPIRARAKLDETLHSLWIQLADVWKSEPLSLLSGGDVQLPVLYMRTHARAEVERLLSQLNPLRQSALSEFELKDRFPDATYVQVIKRTREIVDDFHSLDLVLCNLSSLPEGQVLLLQHTAATRKRLSDCISHLFEIIASTVDLGHTLEDVPANVARARDELLAQISRFRQDKIASQVTTDEDYALLYAYIIVSGQLSDELLQISSELGRIFPASDDSLVGAVRV